MHSYVNGFELFWRCAATNGFDIDALTILKVFLAEASQTFRHDRRSDIVV